MVKICIIDSGFERSALPYSTCISGIDFEISEKGFTAVTKELEDSIGHGTSVVLTILEQNSEIELVMCKLFDDDFMADQEKLLFILEYVAEHIPCDILHMSFGITNCDCIKSLNAICQKIKDKGTYIVSAYDNAGAVSYPACFESVIGVDSFLPYTGYQYEFIENSIVNVRLNIGLKRFSINGQHYLFNGSSFGAAYITGLLSKHIKTGQKVDCYDILRRNAGRIETNRRYISQEALPTCKKAVLFPFNKEMHSIVKFSKQLSFRISNIFDSPRSGNVGKQLEAFLKTEQTSELVIQNINYIDWEDDFDLFILGHQNRLSKIEHKEYEREIIARCKEHGKVLFTFDQPREEYGNVYFPHIHSRFYANTYQKLYQISSPIVGVFGTSSSQGKFSLQLALRNLLQKDGYQVGHLGTEPQSELFGIDCVYPCGYNQKIDLSQEKQAQVINQMMAEIDQKGVDIILCGSQSGTIPYMQKNIQYVTYIQMVYAFAIMPDLSILCVNEFDDLDYIQRTIYFLESIENNRVFALALFPKTRISLTTQKSKYKWLSHDQLSQKANYLEEKLHRDVFIMDELGITELYKKMIHLLS